MAVRPGRPDPAARWDATAGRTDPAPSPLLLLPGSGGGEVRDECGGGRRSSSTVDGLGGSVDGLAGLAHGFFLFFYLLRRASNHLSKYVIYLDDGSEAAMVAGLEKHFPTASENEFCSSVMQFLLIQYQMTDEYR